MLHGIKIIKYTGIFSLFLLTAPLHILQAENSYGFNIDEGVNILQKEQLRLQYNRRYQQQHQQQRQAKKLIKRTVAQKHTYRAVTHVPATAKVASGGCVDCYDPSSPARPLTRTSSSHSPAARATIPEADSLFLAATNGDVSSISRLLAQGVNVNAMNSGRETALHMAAARGHYSALIYLLNHGANINARTTKNWVPLHHAVRFRHANIANYLLRHGSSATIRTSDGMTAIDMARRNRDQRMLNILGAR
jgi:hypothetical protein